jgi:hypothetical protein
VTGPTVRLGEAFEDGGDELDLVVEHAALDCGETAQLLDGDVGCVAIVTWTRCRCQSSSPPKMDDLTLSLTSGHGADHAAALRPGRTPPSCRTECPGDTAVSLTHLAFAEPGGGGLSTCDPEPPDRRSRPPLEACDGAERIDFEGQEAVHDDRQGVHDLFGFVFGADV